MFLFSTKVTIKKITYTFETVSSIHMYTCRPFGAPYEIYKPH